MGARLALSEIVENYWKVLATVESLAQHSGAQLVLASKEQSAERLNAIIASANQRGVIPHFGENYLQELEEKLPLLQGDFKLHFIGALQSNKVKKAVKIFDVIQTAGSEKLLRIISDEAVKAGKVQKIYLQVNISNDDQKAGFAAEELNPALFQMISELAGLDLQGLMTITKFYAEPEEARPDFFALAQIAADLEKSGHVQGRLHLSMGMSADYQVALACGADLVRVGTAVFGQR